MKRRIARFIERNLKLRLRLIQRGTDGPYQIQVTLHVFGHWVLTEFADLPEPPSGGTD